MAEYIEAKDLQDFRDEIMDKFLSLCNYNDYNKLTLLRIGETIDKIYDKYYSKPLADVVEIRHGEWVDGKWEDGDYKEKCNQCHEWSAEYYRGFCSSCGAKMDGKEQNDALD